MASPPEAELKAALLYNFARFTEWPADALPPKGDLAIAVIGDGPDAPALDLIAGRSIAGHAIVVRRSSHGEGVERCQVVYVCRSERKRWPELAKQLAGRPVLVASEIETATHSGAVVRLFWVGNRMRFEINVTEGRRRSLRMAPELLSLADIYKEDEPALEGSL